jgi:hypothetical protein
MTSRIVWEDRWGEVIDRPDLDLVEIRWYDTTRDLDTETFNAWLARFADTVADTRRPRILIDSTAFHMPVEHLDGEWRDAHIIPRYNDAGVEKFAFLMPEDMPAIGAPPAREGPATFPTAYFGTRDTALAWLAEAEDASF